MSRLTKEREQEIRKQQEGTDGCFEIGELLSEIDALRAELSARPIPISEVEIDLAIQAAKLEKDRDQLKTENETMKQKLSERVAKLRECLNWYSQKIYLCPEGTLFDWEKPARNALAQDDEMEEKG
jgi:vacuolar-type H+-ATPase subunit I/STV1